MSSERITIDALDRFVARAKRLVEDSGIEAPPINPGRLARFQGITRVVLSSALHVSGQLTRRGEELIIRLNAREPTERRNFTCCHEIAHTFALEGATAAFRTTSCSESSPEEFLCDRAAAEMLMPEKFFRLAAAGLEPSMASVLGLARQFGASVRATVLRLGQVAVWPVVFIVWKFTAPLGGTLKLRVSWSVRPQGARCFVPRHAAADPGSGMYATFSASYPTVETEALNLGSLRGRYLVENERFGDYVLSIVYAENLRRGT